MTLDTLPVDGFVMRGRDEEVATLFTCVAALCLCPKCLDDTLVAGKSRNADMSIYKPATSVICVVTRVIEH